MPPIVISCTKHTRFNGVFFHVFWMEIVATFVAVHFGVTFFPEIMVKRLLLNKIRNDLLYVYSMSSTDCLEGEINLYWVLRYKSVSLLAFLYNWQYQVILFRLNFVWARKKLNEVQLQLSMPKRIYAWPAVLCIYSVWWKSAIIFNFLFAFTMITVYIFSNYWGLIQSLTHPNEFQR